MPRDPLRTFMSLLLSNEMFAFEDMGVQATDPFLAFLSNLQKWHGILDLSMHFFPEKRGIAVA